MPGGPRWVVYALVELEAPVRFKVNLKDNDKALEEEFTLSPAHAQFLSREKYPHDRDLQITIISMGNSKVTPI
ncbi:hypothetical protein PTTG_28054 [Puccinia triticina 1-1 BBBD Race 1]|uniref:Uncharacterized protein n=1 Tax=Puccinia triticina (isolate 1-1 / race 1 (BBBD)) TaxID=630390 RepID=A0A180GEN1_PUCT1|nr:hypothetical protein PTTG_28054 [Puccinia triticina 1-1 BBBD Race 1]